MLGTVQEAVIYGSDSEDRHSVEFEREFLVDGGKPFTRSLGDDHWVEDQESMDPYLLQIHVEMARYIAERGLYGEWRAADADRGDGSPTCRIIGEIAPPVTGSTGGPFSYYVECLADADSDQVLNGTLVMREDPPEGSSNPPFVTTTTFTVTEYGESFHIDTP